MKNSPNVSGMNMLSNLKRKENPNFYLLMLYSRFGTNQIRDSPRKFPKRGFQKKYLSFSH